MTSVVLLVAENEDELYKPPKNYQMAEVLKGHGFTGCGKTRSCGRPGIYPRHKANRISPALAAEVCSSGISCAKRAFFRSLLQPCRKWLKINAGL